MTRLFRGETEERRERIQRKVFLLLRGTVVEKRSMSSGFPLLPPTPLSPVVHTPECIHSTVRPVAGVYARTSNQSRTGYRRVYTDRHQRRGVSSSGEWKTFSSPSWISPIRGLLPRQRAMPEQRCFSRATVATKVHIRCGRLGPPQVRTWRGFSSPFRHCRIHISLRAKECSNLMRYRYLLLIRRGQLRADFV